MYGFAAALYLIAFTRRHVEPELSRFGYVCIAFTVVSYARFRFIGAHTPEEAAFALELSAVGRYLLGGTFVAMCAGVSRSPSMLVPFAGLWSVLGILLVLAGVHGDLTPEGSYTVKPAGAAMFALGLILATGALLIVRRQRGHDPYVRRVSSAAAICLGAAWLDAAISALALPRIDVLAYAGMVGVGMVHWTLLDRFGEATEELARRRAAYAASLEDLVQKHEQLAETEQLAAVGSLSAVIAHEVRNPLAVIRNATSAIRKGTHGDRARAKLVEILEEEAERLHKLAVELSTFAEHGKPNFALCDVASLFDRCVRRAQAQYPRVRDGEIRFEVHVEVESLVGDRDLLENALHYLVQNAVDATSGPGVIALEARDAEIDGDPAVELCVVDCGEGMDPETLEKAATPFFTTRSRGTGLALAIVDRIAANHGGRLSFSSQKGEGTTARLLLPRRRASQLPSLLDVSIADLPAGSTVP